MSFNLAFILIVFKLFPKANEKVLNLRFLTILVVKSEILKKRKNLDIYDKVSTTLFNNYITCYK